MTQKPAERPARITAINLVRLFVIALVISTHIAASGPLYNSFFSGCVWMVSHVSRLLFVTMTALVLTYNYGPHRPFNLKNFYRKRFTLIALPYVTWTLIYQVDQGIVQHSIGEFLGVFWNNLLTGQAMYHLYFLLVTMQVYLLFPLLRWAYGKVASRPLTVFAVSFGLQVILTGLLQYLPAPAGFGWYWGDSAEKYIWTYQFYIVCGMLVATHVGSFSAFVRKHSRPVKWVALGSLVASLIYYVAWARIGLEPAYIAAVYQPLLVITSMTYGLYAFSLAFAWVERGEPLGRFVGNVAEDSFGIYLSHVYFVHHFSVFQPQDNGFLIGLATLIIELPLVYGCAFAFSEIARRTPVSILLTGRKRVKISLLSWQG